MHQNAPVTPLRRHFGVGGSPILQSKFYHRGSKGSLLYHSRRPPSLPQSRSRSLDTALDRATSNSPSCVRKNQKPQNGSVTGSIYDSTSSYSVVQNDVSVTSSITDASNATDSIATGSVTDYIATSDTDASDSGIFQKYTMKGFKSHTRKRSISDNHVTHYLPSPQIRRRIAATIDSNIHQTKNKKYISNELKSKFEKSVSQRKTQEYKEAPVKAKLPSETKNESVIRTDKLIHLKKYDKKLNMEVDPYNNFYNRKLNNKQKIMNDGIQDLERVADRIESNINENVQLKSRSLQHNPYVVSRPSDVVDKNKIKFCASDRKKSLNIKTNKMLADKNLIMPQTKRDTSPLISSSASSPCPASTPPDPRSPSILSTSSTSSLPYKVKESVFKFPKQGQTIVNNLSNTFSRIDNPYCSKYPGKTLHSIYNNKLNRIDNSNDSSNASTPSIANSPTVLLKNDNTSASDSVVRRIREDVEDTDPDIIGSHLDLVASCEKYLQDDEVNQNEFSDDESTITSNRRSSISSISSSSTTRRKRLSSIPLDDNFCITDQDLISFASTETGCASQKSSASPPQDLSIFSQIASLANLDKCSKRFSGTYEGVSDDTPDSDSKTIVPNDDGDESLISESILERSGSAEATKKSMPETELLSDKNISAIQHKLLLRSDEKHPMTSNNHVPISSSIIDKCVHRVKSFIKK